MSAISKDQNSTEAGKESELTTDGCSSVVPSVSRYQKRVASCLLDSTRILREELNSKELPAQILAIFLEVAHQPEPKGVVELGVIVGVSRAAASRIVGTLGRGNKDRNGNLKPGLDVVEAFEDSSNWSRKLVRLTQKGIDILAKVETRFRAFSRGAKEE